MDKIIQKNGQTLTVKAVNLRDGKAVTMAIENDEYQNSSTIQINTLQMEIASDIIQDFLGNFLKVSEFTSKCSFPHDMRTLNEEILQKIQESNQLKTHFAANISESI